MPELSGNSTKHFRLLSKLSDGKEKMLNRTLSQEALIESEMEETLKEFHGKQTVKYTDVLPNVCFVFNRINFIYSQIHSFVLEKTVSIKTEDFHSGFFFSFLKGDFWMGICEII